MRKVRSILVAVKNPQAKSQPAVAKAAQLARAFGAELHLFHAIDEPVQLDALAAYAVDLERYQRDRRDAWLAELGKQADRVRRHEVSVSTGAEWDYPAHEAIVRAALRCGADLIVAERHAEARRATWLLSYTDWELLRAAPMPVLIVKSPRPWRRPGFIAAIDPTHAYAKPSRLDTEILRAGSTMADALGGPLHVMHAYLPLPVVASAVAVNGYMPVRQVEAAARTEATERLQKALAGVDLPIRSRLVIEGHPVDAIPAGVRRSGSSVVVMGAISRSGLKRLFIGNTAEQVLDALPCDVLVVKPPRYAIQPVPRRRRGARVLATPPIL
jgi:universal stress protein E